MPKNVKGSPGPKRAAKPRQAGNSGPGAAVKATPEQPAPAAASGSLDTLKENIKRIEKGNLFDALKRVKDMKPEQWKDPNVVRELTQNIAQDIGVNVDPRRIDAFMNAYTDVTKNAGEKGPTVSVEEIAKKYGGNAVDEKTIKEIKKFVK